MSRNYPKPDSTTPAPRSALDLVDLVEATGRSAAHVNRPKNLHRPDEIFKHLAVSRPTFKLLLEAGLPAAFFNQRSYAHVDHLDNFLNKLTHPHSQFVKNRATTQIDEDPE